MENQINFSVDLSTKTGLAILAAVFAAVNGGAAVPTVNGAEIAKPAAAKAAAPKAVKPVAAPAAVETEAEEAAAEEAPVEDEAAPEAKVVKMPAKPAAPAKVATPAKPAAATPAKPAAPVKPAAATPAKPAAPAKVATPAKPAAAAKPAATAKPTAGQILATPYADQVGDDAKLAHLMAHVTKHTKNGKGSDVKALLAQYSVDRASELDPQWYDSFNDAIQMYSDGMSVAEIFPDAE